MAPSIDAEIKALLNEATKRIEQAQRADLKGVAAHTKQRGLFRRRVRRVWGPAIDLERLRREVRRRTNKPLGKAEIGLKAGRILAPDACERAGQRAEG